MIRFDHADHDTLAVCDCGSRGGPFRTLADAYAWATDHLRRVHPGALVALTAARQGRSRHR